MKKYLFLLSLFLVIPFSWSQNENRTISGTVYNKRNKPFPDVNVSILGTGRFVKTDEIGEYSFYVNSNDTLVFTYDGYFPSMTLVGNNTAISVYMKIKPIVVIKDEEREGALGIKINKNAVTTASQTVTSEDLLIGRNPNTILALQDKVSGLNVHTPIGGRGTKEIFIRGIRTLKGGNSALIVIDGVISDYGVLETMDNNIIESITVIKGANGAALYGSLASNGVVVVKTRKNFSEYSSNKNTYVSNNSNQNYYGKKPKVKIKKETPDYIQELENVGSKSDAFAIFTKNKDNYLEDSAYYLDMYDFFYDEGESDYSKQILNDVIKSNTISHDLLRAFAYKLEASKNYDEASAIYSKILNMQPGDVKSYRDLANTYQEMNKNQIAFNTLSSLTDVDLMSEGDLTSALRFKSVILNEVNRLLQEDSSLNTDKLAGHNVIKTTYDLRIVIDWNRDDVELNLKVVDPNLETCSSNNPVSRIGGEFTDISGLNEYTIRNARKGNYFLIVDNSSDIDDSVTFLKVTIFKNYGETNETSEVKIIRLTKLKKQQAILKIEV